jgi:molybdopterin-guanine dinucleotide biosynthesis protein A
MFGLMIPSNQLTGAVLAGGHSRRMGRDKSLLEIDGQPLWRHQVAVLGAAGCVSVGVVRRPDQAPLPLPPGIPLWVDSVLNAGPLAGLHAALLACRTDLLVVVAVDLPRLDPAWFDWLASSCGPGRGAIARHPGGEYEPLAAIYPRAALVGVTARLHGLDLSLQSLAAALVACGQLAAIHLPAGRANVLANWNTPADAALNAADPASAE